MASLKEIECTERDQRKKGDGRSNPHERMGKIGLIESRADRIKDLVLIHSLLWHETDDRFNVMRLGKEVHHGPARYSIAALLK